MTTGPIPTPEQVNHPSHYNAASVECIDVIEWLPCNLANAVKYVWRAGLKGDIVTDLKKALWYVEREGSRMCTLDWESLNRRSSMAPHVFTKLRPDAFGHPDQYPIISDLIETDYFANEADDYGSALHRLERAKARLAGLLQRLEEVQRLESS